jgi:uncharacterized protein
MQFEWDENKNKSNFNKHGLSFSLARQAFTDPNLISIFDGIYDGEERWTTLGMIGPFSIIVVISTMGDDDNGEEIIRIISARRAEPKERRVHERENGQI